MRIGYVAKHDSGGNDDEGAITHALTALGHRVDRLRECRGHVAYRLECDFVLYHHYPHPEEIARVKVPKVFWCFDRIVEPDCPELAARNEKRFRWACDMLRVCDLGFFTDGDWVANDETRQARWLPQGADERVIGLGVPDPRLPQCDLLFAGSVRGCGHKRAEFLDYLRKCGLRVNWIEKGVYGRDLAREIAQAKLVVAPPFPCSTRYWSNRAYVSLGFGATLLHPDVLTTVEHANGNHYIGYDYRTLSSLQDAINLCMSSPLGDLREIGLRGYYHTLNNHLYRHRCEQLVAVVERELL